MTIIGPYSINPLAEAGFVEGEMFRLRKLEEESAVRLDITPYNLEPSSQQLIFELEREKAEIDRKIRELKGEDNTLYA